MKLFILMGLNKSSTKPLNGTCYQYCEINNIIFSVIKNHIQMTLKKPESWKGTCRRSLKHNIFAPVPSFDKICIEISISRRLWEREKIRGSSKTETSKILLACRKLTIGSVSGRRGKNPRGSDFEMYAWHFLTRSFLFLHERASNLEGRFKAPAAVRTHTSNEIPFSPR